MYVVYICLFQPLSEVIISVFLVLMLNDPYHSGTKRAVATTDFLVVAYFSDEIKLLLFSIVTSCFVFIINTFAVTFLAHF